MERFNTIYEGAFHQSTAAIDASEAMFGEVPPTREICYSRTTFPPIQCIRRQPLWVVIVAVLVPTEAILGPTLEQLTQDLFSQCQSPQSSS
jgi:hypothetical protein